MLGFWKPTGVTQSNIPHTSLIDCPLELSLMVLLLIKPLLAMPPHSRIFAFLAVRHGYTSPTRNVANSIRNHLNAPSWGMPKIVRHLLWHITQAIVFSSHAMFVSMKVWVLTRTVSKLRLRLISRSPLCQRSHQRMSCTHQHFLRVMPNSPIHPNPLLKLVMLFHPF